MTSTPLALLVLFAFGAACAVAGALWEAARRREALAEATQGRLALLALADAWIWETDAADMLVAWRPPAGSDASWTQDAPLGATLPSLFDESDPAAAVLKRQLDAHAPVDERRVALSLGGLPEPWILRATPRFSPDGRFAGYVGSARPAAADESAPLAQAALSRVSAQAGAAVFLYRRAQAGLPWRLQHANDEARALAGGAVADDWDAACEALPAPLPATLSGLADGEARSVGGFLACWSRVAVAGDEDAGRLLVVRRLPASPPAPAPGPAPASAPPEPSAPVPAASPAASEAAAEEAADHESFIYSVSHDLRAPIRVVEGFARILKEDYGRALDRIGNDHTERILAAAARMNHMIDALLALSRLASQPLKRQRVDLSQLASWIVEDLQREQPDRRAEVTVEPGLVVQGDPTLLRNAMENLLGNAWKYSARNPAARIAVRRETRDDGQPVYVVEDNGAGFDMRFADRLFGVFQRLHSAKDFHGTGVGLASVKRILRRHGGDIWAESEVGKGARFYFTLP